VKVIVGLGNPGKRYRNTPHNVGFAAVDALAGALGCRMRRGPRFRARVGKTAVDAETVRLLKPETYMNDSGAAVGPFLRYHRGGAGDLVVVLDDADLELGRLRVRPAGGSGGHRGLASVIDHVGSDAFARIRIGIGRQRGGDLVEHVLSPIGRAEGAVVDQAVARAAEAALCLIRDGVEAAMNRYNGPAPAGDRTNKEGKGEADIESV